MKILIRVLMVLAALAVVAALVVTFYGGRLIKSAVNTVGPAVLGVPVTLQDARFSLFSGQAELHGLHIGNPPGFKTEGLFDLGTIDVLVDMPSLRTDTLVIKHIRITEPVVTYERALASSNLGRLLEHLKGQSKDKAGEASKEKAPSGRKVIIEELTLADAKLNVTVTAAGGYHATLPLPGMTLKDLGKDKKGASVAEVIAEVIGAIVKSVADVVKGAGKLVGEVGGLAVDGVTAVGEGAVSGVAEGGKLAVEGVEAVGGAVVGGAGKVIGGVGNLLGGGKEKEKEEKDKAAKE